MLPNVHYGEVNCMNVKKETEERLKMIKRNPASFKIIVSGEFRHFDLL